jgi:hypothetical protein
VSVALTVRQRDVLAVLANHEEPVTAGVLPTQVGAGLAGVRRCLAALIRRGLARAHPGSPVTYEITPLGRAALAVDGGRHTTTPAPPTGDDAEPAAPPPPGQDASRIAIVERDATTAQADKPVAPPLTGEVAALAARLDELEQTAEQVDELAALVTELADTVTTTTAPATEVTASWLDFPSRPVVVEADAEELLTRLAAWVGGVYLRYRDALTGFPECWLWHPEIVEELLWLHRAWQAAYAPRGPASLLGDWHDRQRPGVVRRVKDYAGMCSLEAHLPGMDRHHRAAQVPVLDAIAAVAEWWITGRAEPGPVPTAEQISQANLAARYTAHTRR